MADATAISTAGVGTPLLAVRDLRLRFGGITALDGVTFTLAANEIVGLIGPNGAGKTSLFNCISRLYRPDSGGITFAGAPLPRRPHRMAALGIARTFQIPALFPTLSVFDNVRLGGHAVSRSDFLSDAFRLPWVRREDERLAAQARALIGTLGLDGVAPRRADGLPLALRKRVELARSLMMRPRLLMLDEPAAGLDSAEGAAFAALIGRIRRERAVAILLIEHDIDLVMSVCDRVVVLESGRMIAAGAPAAVRADPGVARAYLGSAAAGGPAAHPPRPARGNAGVAP